MEILHDTNINPSNICKKYFAKMKKKGIYHDIINGKYYIIKKNNNELEAKYTLKIVNAINKITPDEQIFFVNIRSMIKCNKNYIYIMENIELPELRYIYILLNKKWRSIFLLQSLVSIFILNHTIGYYHNDLYYKNDIRNIMINNQDIRDDFYFDNIKIPTSYFCTVMIDFGWSSQDFGFRTKEYHEKYFANNKFVSEVLIFAYIYFIKTQPINSELIFEQSLKISDMVDSRMEYDREIIKFVYSKIKKYLD